MAQVSGSDPTTTDETTLAASLERYKSGIVDHADDDTREITGAPRTEEQWVSIRKSFATLGFE